MVSKVVSKKKKKKEQIIPKFNDGSFYPNLQTFLRGVYTFISQSKKIFESNSLCSLLIVTNSLADCIFPKMNATIHISYPICSS